MAASTLCEVTVETEIDNGLATIRRVFLHPVTGEKCILESHTCVAGAFGVAFAQASMRRAPRWFRVELPEIERPVAKW